MDSLDSGLTQGTGYGVVVGLGLGFAIIMIGISKMVARYTDYDSFHSSEEFSSASRSIKMGFISSGIVSAAVWASTLLQSATVTFYFGVGAPWWYCMSGGSQIALFAQNAVMLKRNAPGAHTFLEVIKKRWGPALHIPIMCVGLGVNIILTAQLITGSSATFHALTGMNTIAACILIPLGVVIYTVFGGLRATFLSDYIHTAIIFVALLAMMFKMFANHPDLGSPSKVYDLLMAATPIAPVADNYGGSYLTMRSGSGAAFGALATVCGSVTVFLDQTYWQRAVASKASTGFEGYILGGLCFMPVPLAFATAAGLGLIALSFPAGSPYSMSSAIAANAQGLVGAAGINALLGSSGAILLIIIMFLAVTSAASAELVAVSSICVYDIYKAYINPKPTDKQVMWITHAACVFYGCIMAIVGIIFDKAGIQLGWLFGFNAVYGCCAIFPVGMAIRVKSANRWFCLAGLIIGFIAGVGAWLGTAKGYYGLINVTTTGGTYPQLAGGGASAVVSGIICFIGMFVAPEDFDFNLTRRKDAFQLPGVDASAAIEKMTGQKTHPTVTVQSPGVESMDEEKKGTESSVIPADDDIYVRNDVPDSVLKRKFVQSVWATVIAQVGLCFIVPALMMIPKIWSKAGFTVWIVFIFICTFLGAFVTVLLPIWESRKELGAVCKAIGKDLGIVKK